MSTVEISSINPTGDHQPPPIPPQANGRRSFHRLQEVRVQQGVSVRSVARKLGLTMQEVREQEDPHRDRFL